jgi:antitoxin YokJ
VAAPDPLEAILGQIAARDDCHVHPPRGQASVPAGLALPWEIRRFHALCGGATLFVDGSLPLRVSGPDELVPAAPRLMTPDIAAELRQTEPEGVASTCFVIVDNGEGGPTEEHVVVDLHPARLGRYYATFWDRFGVEADMPIVATSLAGLLEWLIATGGEEIL